MNRDQANDLVRQTFTQAFDKVRFHNFTLNLLNRLDESKAFTRNSQYVKEAFRGHVQGFERLGTYTSPKNEKLDVLIVHLTHESKLERARTAIRNFVADHLKTRDEKDAALVAFVSPSESTWRFSYIKMEYATVEKDAGQVSVEARLTPARRFSYIVGEGESCHTAQTRFFDLLQDTGKDPALAHLEEAFSVEAVTKEFFTKYVKLFQEIHTALEKLVAKDETLREELTARGVNTVDFAKKLMGQIVFLYFLQRKGWLGVTKGQDWGSGPRDFLRRLAKGEYGKYGNFFNDILEPLFYDTLATDRGHEAWCNRFECRIPFLNGGLFEPPGDYDWRKTDIILPNKLFTNSEFVEEGITGTGVLDVFDRYNFTVNEAEPLEREVAIDPEMLGKVFENLIEDNRRKGLGAYYTPREIVHYMCQESLINYLDTALNPPQTCEVSETSQVLVPRADIETFVHLGEQISHYEAVETAYRIRMPKSIEPHARLIDDKLAEITICDPAVGSGAFPVGMMTEIVRARSALTPYFNDVHERTPYHFKRHAIQNCLYGVDIDAGAVEIAKLRLWLSLVVDEEDVKQIKPLPNLDYKIVAGNSLLGFPFKSQRLVEIEKLKDKLFDETDHAKKAELKAQVDKLLAECFAASKKSLGYEVNFDFEIYFSEVFNLKGGFDAVIANPPYVRQEEITPLKPTLRSGYASFDGRADLFVYFYERAVKALKVGGVLTFISSNKWMRAKYGGPLRHFMSKYCLPQIILDFGELPVFSAATFPMIFIGQKGRRNSCRFAQVTSLESPYPDIGQVLTSYNESVPTERFGADAWTFTNQNESAVIAKMLKSPGRISPKLIMAGIKTGFNNAFWLDAPTKDALIAQDRRCLSFIKPLLVGDDIRAWRIKPVSTWIIYTPIGTDPKSLGPIKTHLQKCKERLEQRALSQAWYELQQAQQRYCRLFENPKIVYPDIAKEPRFTLDDRGRYIDMTAFAIASADKSLLAVLNSRAVWFFLKRTAAVLGDADKGGRLRLKRQYLEKIPIPTSPSTTQEMLESLVSRILSAKRRDPEADTTALEREIDHLVYKLYGLTPEEIAIVEGR
jgi:hypothetical protein